MVWLNIVFPRDVLIASNRPNARDYLVSHPNITIDGFAETYGMSLYIRWPYDSSLVAMNVRRSDRGGIEKDDFITNPIFEQHIGVLENWAVGDAFRQKWPDIAKIIESHEYDQTLRMIQ
jgi:hypothetical protein